MANCVVYIPTFGQDICCSNLCLLKDRTPASIMAACCLLPEQLCESKPPVKNTVWNLDSSGISFPQWGPQSIAPLSHLTSTRLPAQHLGARNPPAWYGYQLPDHLDPPLPPASTNWWGEHNRPIHCVHNYRSLFTVEHLWQRDYELI